MLKESISWLRIISCRGSRITIYTHTVNS
jgi:hypothetical protein